MHELLRHTAHRPIPLSRLPWVMQQTWNDLLFAHWEIEPEYLRACVPPQLELDTYDGRAYVAVTPFHMTDVRFRHLPPVPTMSAFPEINVRTYVKFNGVPGVYFFSLDITSVLATIGARMGYALPYFMAEIKIWTALRAGGPSEPAPSPVDAAGETGDSTALRGRGKADFTVHYRAARNDVDRANRRFHGNVGVDAAALRQRAEFRGRYWTTGPARESTPGTLEHFLTERYCLYSVLLGRVYRGHIHHLPWPLQPAAAAIETNTFPLADGIRLPEGKPLLHFAKRLEVLVWWPQRVA